MLTRTSTHAIRAMLALCELEEGEFAGAGKLARRIGAPPNYLGKLLQQLAREGLLESRKGKTGGFALARPPGSITLLEIVEPLEQISRLSSCILGRPRCDERNPCALHRRYGAIRNQYLDLLRTTTLADLA